MAVEEDQRPHAVFIPYPLQGHIIPAVHLALKLASRGFTITFINTEAIHHQTTSASGGGGCAGADIFAGARESGLDIRYETVSDGLPVEFDRSLNHDQFMASLLHVASAHVEAVVRRAKEETRGTPVTCMIADTFFVWTATVARRLRLVHVSFWTEPALVFTQYYHLDLLRRNGHFGCNDKREDPIHYIPGVPSLDPSDLTSYLQVSDTTSVVHQIIYKAFDEAKHADFVLCNTVHELEPSTVSGLNACKSFYPIGPVFSSSPSPSTPVVPTSLWAESDCAHWLSSRPAASVLYISFGSYAHLCRPDLWEIAAGIADSNVSFLWVLRPDIISSDDPNPLPKGFKEETEGRGLVVPWCNQVEVLRHPAIGGFLTHCGWNSILESLWEGVPMMCFPLLTDQFTNRRLVVRDWGVGLEGRGKGRGVGEVRRGEVRRRVIELMEGVEGKKARREVERVRRELQGAVASGGSSQRNLDRFVQDLTKHIRRKVQ